jgi:hypothetical protein
MLQKSGEKKNRDLNLEFFGGYFTFFFAKLNSSFFSDFSFSLVFLFIIHSQKSQDFCPQKFSFTLFFFALLHHMVEQYYHLFLKMEDVMERDNKRCRIIAAVFSSIFICGIASKIFIVEGRLGNRTDASKFSKATVRT